MQLGNQVCTLKQAKRLKELGVAQEALFYWIDRAEMSRVVYAKNIEFLDVLPIIAAFTVAELGQMMPAFPECNWQVYYHSGDQEWRVGLGGHERIPSPTEAHGRAALLIHMLQRSYTTAEECNQRLSA